MLRKDISKFTYSPIDIRRSIKTEDFWKFKLKTDDIERITNDVSNRFVNNNADVDTLNIHNIKNNRIFTNGSLYNALTIRRTNEILKNTFLFQTYSRDQEVKQLWNIIDAEKRDSYVFRTDIKSFFEALPFKQIIDDLFRNNLVTRTTYFHLINIYLETSKDGFEGLPRGLPISSSLSEVALETFDYKARNEDECFYYTRYVDDIVLVTTNRIKNIKKIIEKKLPYELKLNSKKTFHKKIGTNSEIEFLGYCFNLEDGEYSRISKSKLNKIKTRIALSLRCFVKRDKNFDLLSERLKFLSGNSVLKMAGRKKPITIGIRYQYQLCSEKSIFCQLKELDTFFKGMLFSKTYFIGKELRQQLSTKQVEELNRISFLSGYKNKITHSYSRARVSRIKDAWRYE